MEFLPRQFLLGVCTVALAIGLADAVHGETVPVVVGLARCSDCTRKNMNAEAAFKGLQVVVKCKSSKGEYESKAVGQLDKSGAFSVPLAADLVGVDGELKHDCLAQLHSASNMPCPGQEPSKIVAAPSHGGKTAFMALAGKVHEPSAECASAFLCHPPMIKPPKHDHDHPHLPGIKPPKHDHDHPHLPSKPIPPKHDHDHDHDLPPAGKPIPPKHDHDHDHALPPVAMPPKPMPIYGPPSERNAVTDPQLFKKMLPFLKKLPFFPPAEQNTKP
ncbi:proline-rich protein 2 [Lolium perenne]|uniref:proline-rich protein 2 n=1 Tax=Lolium perenne TaxID=4522 RepID=UPI0021EAA4CB|nr:proline-rich protein 4-like [Lolium perenne]